MAASLDPEAEYLLPAFDPATLTVPRLRSILVEHSVNYPSSAKKGQLVEIFNENIVPQAKRILSARSRVKRSTRGIEDVPSSHEPSVDENASDEDRPAPETSRRSSRRLPRASTIETLDGGVDVETPTAQKSSRKSSGKQSRISDGEVAADPATARSTSRRTRISAATPVIKQEEDVVRRHDNDSPFTAENPFQSGASPLLGSRSVSSERRRRTVDPVSSGSDKKPAGSRRKTEFSSAGSKANGAAAAAPKTIKYTPTQPKRQLDEDSETEDAGEEFTPEEQAELTQDRAKNGQVTLHSTKRRKGGRQSNGVGKIAPWAVSLAMLGGFATVWRQEKIEVGFCGVGRPSATLGGVQIPEWASGIQPQCEPCPPHAYCYQGLLASCEPDFVLVPHPLSMGGLVPLPPTCEPDGDKARKVKAVADRAVEELRERNAAWECGELKNDEGKRVVAPEMPESELKREVASKRRKSMSQEEFEDLWHAAIGEITNRDEVESGSHGPSGERTLRSTSLANISLGCAARRSLRLALARHLYKLVVLIVVLAGGIYTRVAIVSRRETETRAKQLASFALDRLATQAALHGGDEDRVPEGWISMAQLRDDVLREEFSARRRQRLWEKVQAKVEANSNVRSSIREGRSGEVSRAWEWIGAVGAIEAAGSGRSARFGTPAGSGQGRLLKQDGEEGQSSVERRKWDEGRPIY